MRFPQVKPEHAAVQVAGGLIRIGGDIYGLAGEIADPDGRVWAALRLMDGSRTTGEVAAELRTRFPGLSERAAASLVAQLIESGHVQDARPAVDTGLTAHERERYSRNHAYQRWVDLSPREHGWECQLRLKQARVLLLGLGGTGSTAAWALAASGIGRLHCVDDDRVELSNLSRQLLYGEHDVGRPKVAAALSRLRAVNSDIEITGERRRVGSAAEMLDLVADFDLVALCADEPRGPDGIRVWASRACGRRGLPWVGGGYHGPLVTVGVYVPGKGPCYECVRAGLPSRLVDLGGPGATAVSAGLSGQLVAHAAIRVLTGVPEVTANYVQGINLIAPDHHVLEEYPPGAGCAICAP